MLRLGGRKVRPALIAQQSESTVEWAIGYRVGIGKGQEHGY